MFGRKNTTKKKFETECIGHIDALYTMASKLTGNSTDAEELVQDTYVRAFRFRNKFEWGTNLKAWLFRILTNTFINDFRHRKHHQRYLERATVEPLYDRILSREAREYAANPEKHLFSKFFSQQLETSLQGLPDDFKIVVVLSDIEEFSYREISDILNIPIGTVMSRLHRGRKLLQADLVDYAVAAGVVEETDDTPANLEIYRRRKESSR